MKSSGTLAMCMVLAMLAISSNPATARTCKEPDNVTFVQGKRHCLAIKTFEGVSGAGTLYGFVGSKGTKVPGSQT